MRHTTTFRLVLAVLLATFLLAPFAADGHAAGKGPTFRDRLADGTPCEHCPEMAVIDHGSFAMGSPLGVGHDHERGADRAPVPVRIDYGFAVGVTEITRRQYAAFIAANPGHAAPGLCAGVEADDGLDWRAPGFGQDDDHPVVCVSWRDAKAYTAWLSRITGKTYRLLTEAEWEFVARAGVSTRYWWGEKMKPDRANCLGLLCGDSFAWTAPARSFGDNPFGLFGILGNVWEWTEDCWISSAYRTRADAYPGAVTGPPDCKHVVRGGSWSDTPWSLRASNRDAWRGDRALNDLGFRVARMDPDLPI